MSNKVVTGVVRLTYYFGSTPISFNGGEEKYSTSILIDKTDKATIQAIEKAIEEAITAGIPKFGGKRPAKGALKLPLRDGDIERDDEAYKGCYFLTANSKTAPQIVDRKVQPILDRDEVYSGCYCRVSLNFYSYNVNGSKGVAVGLGNIQKIRDGEPLGGRSSAAADFSEFTEETGDNFLD